MGGDVVIIGNTKGGVGKTALAFNLAYCISGLGVRTLIVDLDVQCGQAAFLRAPAPDADHDAGAVLMGRCSLDDAVQAVVPNLDVLPAEEFSVSYLSRRLEHDDVRARGAALFDDLFGQLRQRWDLVIVDTAGHQTPLLVLAMASADGVVVPISSAPSASAESR